MLVKFFLLRKFRILFLILYLLFSISSSNNIHNSTILSISHKNLLNTNEKGINNITTEKIHNNRKLFIIGYEHEITTSIISYDPINTFSYIDDETSSIIQTEDPWIDMIKFCRTNKMLLTFKDGKYKCVEIYDCPQIFFAYNEDPNLIYCGCIINHCLDTELTKDAYRNPICLDNFLNYNGECITTSTDEEFFQNKNINKEVYLLGKTYLDCFIEKYDIDYYLNFRLQYIISGYNRKENPSKNKCTQKCPSNHNNDDTISTTNYLYDQNTYRCYVCNDTCKECTNPPNMNNNYCTKCKDNFILISNLNEKEINNIPINSCWEKCPIFYGQINYDKQCHFCSYYGYINFMGFCLFNINEISNDDGYWFEEDNSYYHECIFEKYNRTHYFTSYNYISCQKQHDECQYGYIISPFTTDKKKLIFNICEPCNWRCETCSNSTTINNLISFGYNPNCIKCNSKFGLKENKKLKGVCDFPCEKFYSYDDNGNFICFESCPENLPNLQDDFECVDICNKGTYLYGNYCYDKCPNHYYGSAGFCVEICEEFTEIDMINRICIHCELEGKYYFGGKCYEEKNIPQNTFYNDTDISKENEEIDDIKLLKLYQDKKVLISCYKHFENHNNNNNNNEDDDKSYDYYSTGYYYKLNNCSNICPEGYFYLNEKKICEKCFNGCKSCYGLGENECIECENEYEMNPYLIGNCAKKCSKNFYYDNQSKKRVCLNYDECKDDDNNDFIYSISVENSKECVSNCKTLNLYKYMNTCISNCKTTINYQYNYDNICYNKCPYSTGLKFNNNIDEQYNCVKCSEQSLFYYQGICYPKEDIPLNTFFNETDPQSISDHILMNCFNEIIKDNIVFTGYNFKINNCLSECPSNYYKFNWEQCKKCYESCATCSQGYEEHNHHCLTCNIENGFIENNNIPGVCYKKCNKYFYIDDHNEIICVDSCPTLFKYLIENINKCVKSCDSENYYLYKNNKCIEDCSETNDLPYSYDNKCIDKCPQYYGVYNNNDNNNNNNYKCISCAENNLFYYNGICYDADHIPIDLYYDNTTSDENRNNNVLIYCYNYISNDKYSTGYYKNIQNCQNVCPHNFIYSKKLNLCSKCFETCLTCNEIGDKNNNNCIKCKNNYILNPFLIKDDIYNCIPKCDNDFILFDIINNIIKCVEVCDNYIYIQNDNNINEIDINNNFDTKFCYPTCDKNVYINNNNKYCLNSCPKNYFSLNNMCVKNNNSNNITIEYILDTLNGKIDNLISNPNKDLDSILPIYNNIIHTYSSVNEEKAINSSLDNNISYIKLNECGEYIKNTYNDYYILNIFNTVTNKTTFKLYFHNNSEIDIEKICKDYYINVYSKVLMSNESKNIFDKGYDVYDINNEFFSDICTIFSNENGKDVFLDDRFKDYFVDGNKICGDNCIYNGMNVKNSYINCHCKGHNYESNKEKENKDLKVRHKSESIINVFKCYKKVFNKSIKYNYAFWIYFFLFLFMVTLLILFLFFGLKGIFLYLQLNNNKIQHVQKRTIFERKKSYIQTNNKNKNKYNIFTKAQEIINDKNGNFSENNFSLKNNPPKKKTNGNFIFKSPDKDNIITVQNSNKKFLSKYETTTSSINNFNNEYLDSENNTEFIIKHKNNFEKKKTSFINKNQNNINNDDIYISNFNNNLEKKNILANTVGTFNFNKKIINFNNINDNINEKVKKEKFNESFENNDNKNEISNISNFNNNNILTTTENNDIINTTTNICTTNNKLFETCPTENNNININTSNNNISFNDNSEEKNENNKNNISNYSNNENFNNNNKNNFTKDILNINMKNFKKNDNKNFIYNNDFSNRKFIDINSSNNNPYQLVRTRSNLINQSDLGTASNIKNTLINNISINTKITNENFIDNFDDCDFEEALIYDKRKFIDIYVSFIKNRQIIFSIFYNKNPFCNYIIKLIVLIFTLTLYLTLNILFVNKTILHKRYIYQGNINFKYIMKNEFKNIVYICLIVNCLNLIINLIFNHNTINKFIFEIGEKSEEFFEEVKKQIRYEKIKYIIIICIMIILICLQWYYAMAFCAVFKNSQKIWLISFFITFIWGFITSFIWILIAGICRYFCNKNKSLFLFKISNFILDLN